ncbi:dephospho-CoA kinase [Urechidicola vernalis]|uniref:Dephospho-CoA kinase n=1 Tax=Urechidicola vernalis TaxID=3075600 RepID=A0ABU2Y9Z4_9FLAO|nr:dephospho-CoA kinase [Urechidicola sp. P050]MDT0553888.1 dephospho-CoA kinase [Urechidicola sp. P050]
MILVGLTGLMGSGKSTVLLMFKEFGAAVYNADTEAKLLMHSPALRQEIELLFGKIAYVDEKLNRKYISKVVFDDPVKLKQLNSIVHPAVKIHFENFVANSKADCVVYESALLFQSSLKSLFDFIVVVTAPVEERILRIMKRDNSNKEAIEKRLAHQKITVNELEQADFIIENVAINSTRLSVKNIYSFILGNQ